MKYELEVLSDTEFRVKKLMDVPLWNNNMIFDELEALAKYLMDYVELSCSINEVMELVHSSPMNSWTEFGR